MIEYEHQKAERAGYRQVARRNQRKPTLRAGKPDAGASDVVLNPLVNEVQPPDEIITSQD